MKQPPCKDCKKRRGGCHDHCPAFLEWKAYRNALGEHMRKIRASEADKLRIDGMIKSKKESHRL